MRKKLFTFLLALATSVGMMWAQGPWTSGDCTLTLSGGVMTVSGNGAMADYNKSNPWTSYNSSITSIVIENGVTHVGNGTFPQCTSLVSVVIGDDVETIGEFSFDDAGASLTSVTMGNKVKSIGMAAFLWDTGLPELILSEDLETIGAYAFCRMEALTTITIPSKVTSIGDAAFSNCSALQSIYIEAATPPTLGDGVFANVNADLSTIPLYVPNGSVAAYTAADQWNAFNIQGYDPSNPGSGEEPEEEGDVIIFQTNTQQSSYTQSTVTITCDYAGDEDGFAIGGNSGYTATITNSGSSTISKIELVPGYYKNNHPYVRANGAEPTSSSRDLITFTDVNSNSVTLSMSTTDNFQIKEVRVTLVGGGSPAPANSCGGGLTWELSDGVLTISYDGEGTGEMNDFDYEYDDSPVNVAPWKENKSDIATVVIGDGVKSIGNYAFNDLGENFTAVTIANSVEHIGMNAFMNDNDITEMTLPSSLQTIDKEGLANCGFATITIPSGVTSIDTRAFCYCMNLTSLTCEATTPPTLGTGVFSGIKNKQNIPLYVPSESVDAYTAASQWNAFDVQAIPAPQPELAECGLVWTGVPEGGVVGTIGHEDEVQLPQLYATNPDFINALMGGTATVRLGSTDESVLKVLGFNNFQAIAAGECDVFAVHDADATFAYDSVAFHVTVNPEPTGTVWTSLSVGDVIKVGDKIEVPAEGDGSWGINGNVLRNAWGPYTLIRADIYQASDFDDPVVTELEDGAFYVFKAENSDFYPFSNVAKGGALVVTMTSDGLVVTAAENKEFTVAVHDKGDTPTAIDETDSQKSKVESRKMILNGQLLIIRDGKTYNVVGTIVR